MINIQTIFLNHFDSVKISDGRLKAFCADHMEKLAAWLTTHTDPKMSELLADVTAAYNDYFGSIGDEELKLTLQRSRTLAADNAWTAVLDFIRLKEGIVRNIWGGKDSTEYIQFYPHGIEEYNQATRQNKDTLLDRYLAVATSFAVDLPTGFVADFTELKDDYTTKYGAQQEQIGLVKDAISQTGDSRVPLEAQLSINMLVIGAKNVGHPNRVSEFFTQSLLHKNHESVREDQIVVRGTVTIADTTTPVGGVWVTLSAVGESNPSMKMKTYKNGRFRFVVKNLEPQETGTGEITINAPGFLEFQTTFEAQAGNLYIINPALTEGTMLKKVA